MDRYLTKRNIIIAASIFVLLIAGIVAATIFSAIRQNVRDTPTTTIKKPTAGEAKTICKDEDLVKANKALTTYPNDNAALAEVGAKIVAETNYQYDVNCLYVVVRYYISLSDFSNGLLNLDILKGLYNPAVGYSPIIRDNAISLVIMEETLRGMETQFKETIKDAQAQQDAEVRMPEPEIP